MKNLKRKVLVGLMSVVMLTPMTVGAESGDVLRLEGRDRVVTSMKVSSNAYGKGQAKEVVVAGYKGTADALTGTMLAAEKDAPLLLINKYDSAFKAELKRLGVSKVTLLGGNSVISKDIEKAIRAEGYQVERVAGRDRVDTAVDIMETSKGKGDHVYLTNDGRSGSLADALAIGPVSGRDKKPILLTSTKKLPKATEDALTKYGVTKVTVVGGTTAVSENVVKELRTKGYKVDRVSGTDRYETAIKISDTFFKGSDKAIMTNDGRVSFADALMAGYLGAKEDAPILLTNNKKMKGTLEKHVKDTKVSVKIIGGNSVVDKAVENRLKELLKSKEEGNEGNEGNVGGGGSGGGTGGSEEESEIKLKINSKEELVREIEKRVNNREKGLKVEYTGEKLSNSKGVDELIKEIKSVSTYNIGTLNKTYSVVKGNNGYEDIDMTFFYNTTDREEEYISREARRIKDGVLEQGMTGYEIIKVLHDYVVNNMDYTAETVNSRFSPYTAFKEGKGVCNAYVLMYTRLLDEAGVENVYVIGRTSEGKYHAWNKVKLDGEWYNIDPTWATPEEESGKHGMYYYFMNSDRRFYETRTPRSRRNLPKADSRKYDGMHDGDYSVSR